LVILLCIVFFPVGLYALWKNQSISKGWKIGITIVIALIVLAQLDEDTKNSSSTTDHSSFNLDKENVVRVGDVLRTDYFEIKVNKVSLTNAVNTGNMFADLKPERDNLYLIINVTFKNIDTESRMPTDGSVWINYNGKNYQFDKSETILVDGWGLMFDQLNPLTTKTTNLVYKIPAEIKGEAYWQPGRSRRDQKVYLGNLK
jgi:hypothetical protein